MSERQESGKTFYVYRTFNGAGHLLYVGLATDLVRRFQLHVNQSHWIWRVVAITVDRYTDREVAKQAEFRAIVQERPRWNVQNAENPTIALRERRHRDDIQRNDPRLQDVCARIALTQRINTLTRALVRNIPEEEVL